MSLFREIRRLCLSDKEQIEDILTEIVAGVFRNNEELTREWLNAIEIPGATGAAIAAIDTQYRVSGLPDHDTDSRIDLVIRFSTSQVKRIVFIESKVDSSQAENQLGRYAELLKRECEEQEAEGRLVFITRDFEPVTKPQVKDFAYVFHVTRWFKFYNILKSRSSSDGLEKQLKLFMEEMHMSVGNQFRSTDLVALENFRGAKAMMDETLSEVSDRWSETLGKGGQINKAMGQLRMHGRYMISTRFPGFEVLLGYWLPQGNSDEGISLGLVFYCDPKAKDRAAIIHAFREWAKERGEKWDTEELDNPKAWASLTRWDWLRVFQTSEDHVAAVKTYFIELLDDLESFKARFPKLPWTPAESKDEEEGEGE